MQVPNKGLVHSLAQRRPLPVRPLLAETVMPQTTFLLPDRTVGKIAARLSGATGLFHRFGIDFSGHGDVPLAKAAHQHHLDPGAREAVLAGALPGNRAAAGETTRCFRASRPRRDPAAGAVSSAWTDIRPGAAALYVTGSGR